MHTTPPHTPHEDRRPPGPSQRGLVLASMLAGIPDTQRRNGHGALQKESA